MKSKDFASWFYEEALSFDPDRLVNKFDAEFSSLHDWMEKALETAFNAGFDEGFNQGKSEL